MPKFFFDIVHDGHLVRDDDGVELPDLAAAGQAAIEALPDIARDELQVDCNRSDIFADVRDEAGRIVFTAHLSIKARWV